MSFNLVRNSRLWFTTNVNANTGLLNTGASSTTATNTFELAVLNGFNFSQSTQQTTIQLNEAGNQPVRGQRAFNTALDNVEVTFSTYLKPEGTSTITAEERHLWNALFSADAIDTSGIAVNATNITRSSTTAAQATVACSAINIASLETNGVYAFAGATGSFSTEWGAPFKMLTTISSTSTAMTSFNIEYLTAPSTASGTTSGAQAALSLRKGAFLQMASTAAAPAHAMIHSGPSNKNQLQKFALVFKVDNAVYSVENCVVDQASIDFNLDGIAMVAWTVKGTKLQYLDAATISTDTAAVFGGTGLGSGTAAAKSTNVNYITNKLSTMVLEGNIKGGGTAYTVALTGGNLTISNNVSYVTPDNLGVVNLPITYFTGSRSISGNVTAYLRVGTGNSAQLLKDMITANAAETKFKLQVDVGGISNAIRTEFLMNGCSLQIPTVETADVISTTINFTAQGYNPIVSDNVYDVTQTNDMRIRYFSA